MPTSVQETIFLFSSDTPNLCSLTVKLTRVIQRKNQNVFLIVRLIHLVFPQVFFFSAEYSVKDFIQFIDGLLGK